MINHARTLRRALRPWLALMSVHSIALGIAIYFLAETLLPAQGFDLSGGLFFPRQSGVFLVILGVWYAMAAANPARPLVLLVVFSKAMAVLFLYTEALFLGAPSSILATGAGDTLLGGVALALAVVYYRAGTASQ